MSTVEPEEPREGDASAAEYVLGLLDADERREVEQRLAADPAFAAEVARWWERLNPLLEEAPGREPPASLWPRIEAALKAGPAASTAPPATARPAPSVAAAPAQPRRERDPGPAPEPRKRSGWGRLLAAAFVGALLAGGAFAGWLTYRDLATPDPAGIMMATLSPTEGEALYVAALDADRRAIVVTPTRVLPADERARELWIIPADERPRSAGLLSNTDQPSAVRLNEELYRLAQTGVSLAVSLEQPGGSPTGQPQGPVIASGALVQVG